MDFFVKDRFEETESLLLFKGGWADAYSPALSGGVYKYAWKTGHTAHIAFDGVKLDWVTTKAPNYGIAKVTLDGADPVFVDLYSPTYQYKSPVWSTGELAPGRHEISIEWTGTKNASSSGFNVGVDALDVAGSLLEADIYDPVTTSDIDEAWQNGPVDVTLTRRRRPSRCGDHLLPPRRRCRHHLHRPVRDQLPRARRPSSTGRSTCRGNVEAATSKMVRIDDTAPVSSSDIDEAWQDGPVTVTLGSTDAASRASRRPTTRIDGGAPRRPTPPRSRSLPRAPRPSSTGRSTSWATPSRRSQQIVRIDDTDPVTTSDIDEAWQNGPVDVTLTRHRRRLGRRGHLLPHRRRG